MAAVYGRHREASFQNRRIKGRGTLHDCPSHRRNRPPVFGTPGRQRRVKQASERVWNIKKNACNVLPIQYHSLQYNTIQYSLAVAVILSFYSRTEQNRTEQSFNNNKSIFVHYDGVHRCTPNQLIRWAKTKSRTFPQHIHSFIHSSRACVRVLSQLPLQNPSKRFPRNGSMIRSEEASTITDCLLGRRDEEEPW